MRSFFESFFNADSKARKACVFFPWELNAADKLSQA